jgi:hypothetical protein
VPRRIRRRLESGSSVVQPAKQSTDLPDAVVGPRVRVDERAFDVGDDLAALIVVSVPRHPRGSGETCAFEVPEQSVDSRDPRPGRPDDGASVPEYPAGLPVGI